MNKLLVIYRNNDLFSTYMPEILALIPSTVKVTTLIFPQGTSAEEMAEQMRGALKAVNEPCFFLSDRTCGKYRDVGKMLKDEFSAAESAGMKFLPTLDSAMDGEVKELFKETTFEGLLKIIMPLIVQSPKIVGIVVSNLGDHLYGFKDYEPLMEQSDDFGPVLKGYVKALYPEAKIKFFETHNEAISELGDNPDAVIIADRHTGILSDCWSIDGWAHKSKLFMLPFENAHSHLVKMGLWKEEKKPERVLRQIMGSQKFD